MAYMRDRCPAPTWAYIFAEKNIARLPNKEPNSEIFRRLRNKNMPIEPNNKWSNRDILMPIGKGNRREIQPGKYNNPERGLATNGYPEKIKLDHNGIW